MTRAKLPAFLFYPGDWLKDPELSRCSLAARGAYLDILCFMWECDPRGILVTHGKPWTREEISKVVRGVTSDIALLLDELEAKKVLGRLPNGAYYSRRMVRDEESRNANRQRQATFREKRNGDVTPDVTPSSHRSSSSFSISNTTNPTSSQDAVRREPEKAPMKSGWVDREAERDKKTRAALDAVFPETVDGDARKNLPAKRKP